MKSETARVVKGLVACAPRAERRPDTMDAIESNDMVHESTISMRLAFARFVLATLLGASPLAWAEDRAAAEAAVRAHFAAFAEAFSRGDARSVAAGYAEDADIVRPNQPPVVGRAAIEAFYSQMFDGPLKGVTKGGAVDRVRFVMPAVAVVDSSYTLDRDEPPLHARGVSLTVLVKRKGRWLAVLSRSYRLPEATASAAKP